MNEFNPKILPSNPFGRDFAKITEFVLLNIENDSTIIIEERIAMNSASIPKTIGRITNEIEIPIILGIKEMFISFSSPSFEDNFGT